MHVNRALASGTPSWYHAVLGPMEPGQLGVTLPHEHLLLDFTGAVTDPDYVSPDQLAGLKLEIQNLGKIRQFPYVCCIAMFHIVHTTCCA